METPQFNNDEDFFAWTFQKISEAITNLTQRLEQVEEGLQKIPPPGPDMVKYKIPGNEHYSNLTEIFNVSFCRISEINSRMDDINQKLDIDRIGLHSDNALDNMINIRISDQLEDINQRLNKIESKLGI